MRRETIGCGERLPTQSNHENTEDCVGLRISPFGSLEMSSCLVYYTANPMPPSPAFSSLPSRPELIIAFAGAVGVNSDKVYQKLESLLHEVGYQCHRIHVIDLLQELPAFHDLSSKPEDNRIRARMTAGNTFRQRMTRWDALAVLAMGAIREKRQSLTSDPNTPKEGVAYVIRSIKNPEEVKTFRRIYGPAFILISIYSARSMRLERLSQMIAASENDSAHPDRYRDRAETLIRTDFNEQGVQYGQNLRDAFPLADVFVEISDNDARLESTLRKFIQLLFRHPYHTPNRDEYGMFMAFSGALRSADLGRQVGAAIADDHGDILSVGTNEVPRPGGGQYWDEDVPSARDFNREDFAFDRFRIEIIEDILSRLNRISWLDKKKTKDASCLSVECKEAMEGALYQDVIEYGRTVHAELSAILGAARRGTRIEKAVLYSTTFPCHECARNIVAAGIRKVVYIYPYSKSRVESLFNDSIIVDGEHVPPKDSNRNIPEPIEFVPFVGISPHRYQVLFDAAEVTRKKDGKPIKWDGRKETPKGEEVMNTYSRKFREQVEFNAFFEEMKRKGLFPTKEGRRDKKRMARKAK